MRSLVLPALAAVAMFLLVFASQRLITRFTGETLADAASLTALAVNVVLLFLGILSLVVAGIALSDARRTGAEEQRILDESRKALESLVGQLNYQRTLIDDTLKTSSSHLELVREAYEEERRRLARRPAVAIGIRSIPDDKLGGLIGIPVAGDGWGRVDFLVRNTGDLDLLGATVIVRATPQTISVDRRGLRVARDDRHTVQITADPIRQFEVVQLASAFSLDVRVPPEIAQPFTLRFQIYGEGLTMVDRTFRFQAIRPTDQQN